jgi:hypothetical protein
MSPSVLSVRTGAKLGGPWRVGCDESDLPYGHTMSIDVCGNAGAHLLVDVHREAQGYGPTPPSAMIAGA